MGKPERPKGSADSGPKDPNIISMEEWGMEQVKALNISETRKEYKAKVDGKDYKMVFKVREGEAEVLAIRESDSVMFSCIIDRASEGVGPETAMEMALKDVRDQIDRKHFDEVKRAAFERAEKVARQRGRIERDPARQVAGVIQSPLFSRLVFMGMVGIAPDSFTMPDPTRRQEEGHRAPLPMQAYNQMVATDYLEASEKAREEGEQLHGALVAQEVSKIQTNWSAEYLEPSPCADKDPVAEVMKKHGMEGITITYTPDAMKQYSYRDSDFDVKFIILPHGTIRYESQRSVGVVGGQQAGHAIRIVDFRTGDFQAASLDAAMAQMKREGTLKLDTTRSFIYTSTPGIEPLEVKHIDPKEREPQPDKLYSLESVAQRLFVDMDQLRAYIKAGELEGVTMREIYRLADDPKYRDMQSGEDKHERIFYIKGESVKKFLETHQNTFEEAAKRLKLSKNDLRWYISSGKLKAVGKGKDERIPEKELQAFVDKEVEEVLEDMGLPYPMQLITPTWQTTMASPLHSDQGRAFIYIPIKRGAVPPQFTPRQWYQFGVQMEDMIEKAGEK